MAVDDKRPRGRPPERLLVVVNFKMALSTPAVRSVTWPKHWPIPVVGDQITIDDMTGFVTHLTFDLTAGKLLVNTR